MGFWLAETRYAVSEGPWAKDDFDTHFSVDKTESCSAVLGVVLAIGGSVLIVTYAPTSDKQLTVSLSKISGMQQTSGSMIGIGNIRINMHETCATLSVFSRRVSTWRQTFPARPVLTYCFPVSDGGAARLHVGYWIRVVCIIPDGSDDFSFLYEVYMHCLCMPWLAPACHFVWNFPRKDALIFCMTLFHTLSPVVLLERYWDELLLVLAEYFALFSQWCLQASLRRGVHAHLLSYWWGPPMIFDSFWVIRTEFGQRVHEEQPNEVWGLISKHRGSVVFHIVPRNRVQERNATTFFKTVCPDC